MVDDPLTMRVRRALAGVANPATGRNLVADGLVQALSADADGAVRVTIEAADAAGAATLIEAARQAVAAVEGVARVSVVATSHAQAGAAGKAAGGHRNPLGLAGKRLDADALPGVRHVLVVASGKGGVGKSTLAANLAVAFARRGLTTGLLDADIYGPSLPTLFGLSGKPELRDGLIVPVEKHGVRAMSIGLLVDAEKALAWRGPMVMGAIRQLINDVAWGALDILVIDTPPGTGDAHLSLAQSKRVTGAIIVSTPQEMALADVRRGADLFRATSVPVIGLIENMAWFETPDGIRHDLFGRGGAERMAAALDIPFLGALPLLPALRAASDAGAPPEADSTEGRAFAALAATIAARLAV